MVQTPLPAAACTAAYRNDKAPADDPSIVTFDTDMTLDLFGRAVVISRGKVGCAPMP